MGLCFPDTSRALGYSREQTDSETAEQKNVFQDMHHTRLRGLIDILGAELLEDEREDSVGEVGEEEGAGGLGSRRRRFHTESYETYKE